MDEVIRVQVMSERDAGEDDLEWAGIMEKCRRELSCMCQKMTQAAGSQPGRPCRPHATKPGEQRQKAMRTGRGGYLFTSSNEDSERGCSGGKESTS